MKAKNKATRKEAADNGHFLYIDSQGKPWRVRINTLVPAHEIARFIGSCDWYRAIISVAGPYFSAIVPNSALAPWTE